MSLDESRQILGMGVFVCAFGVVLNLFMLRKRGRSAAILAIAFVFFGIGLLLLYKQEPVWMVAPFAVMMAGLLVFDFLLRLRKMRGRS